MTGAWLWLFPLTYLVHLAEEAWAGERFYRWVARIVGRPIPARAWALLNIAFMVAMLAAVAVAQRGQASWIVPGLGTIVSINAVAHAVSTRITRTYSPGLFSGLLLWLPLGIATLWFSLHALPRTTWAAGIGAGIVVHGIVAVLALHATGYRFRAG